MYVRSCSASAERCRADQAVLAAGRAQISSGRADGGLSLTAVGEGGHRLSVVRHGGAGRAVEACVRASAGCLRQVCDSRWDSAGLPAGIGGGNTVILRYPGSLRMSYRLLSVRACAGPEPARLHLRRARQQWLARQ
jgi:hypothetical protein